VLGVVLEPDEGVVQFHVGIGGNVGIGNRKGKKDGGKGFPVPGGGIPGTGLAEHRQVWLRQFCITEFCWKQIDPCITNKRSIG